MAPTATAARRPNDLIAETLGSIDLPVPVSGHVLAEQPRWSKALSITVDGPAGSGKSTLARELAESLGFQYLDTGATYRALAWLALERGVPLDDGARLRGLAIAQPVQLGYDTDHWTVRIAGHEVTERIREPRIDEAASMVARHDAVRDVLIARQRQLSLQRDSVLDGRDCGTQVRPDADLKLFIETEFEERVRRRTSQYGMLRKRQIAKAMRERDERDQKQSAPAADAVRIDNTSRSIDDIVSELVATWVQRRHDLLDDEVTGGRTAREWIDAPVYQQRDRFRKVLRYSNPIWKGAMRLKAYGEQRVPEGPCLFIANHSSMWDPAFVIVPLDRPIRYMAKIEITKIPGYRDIGDSIGMFPVRRGAGDRVALHIAETTLRKGEPMGLFPEGTRVYDGRLGRPKQGAARLALVTGVPIVPVAIYGNRLGEALRVQVAYGQPHYFDGLKATPANIATATNAVWRDVDELWTALKEGRGA
jgi:cytidylate kinase